jgi:hypothetical protein
MVSRKAKSPETLIPQPRVDQKDSSSEAELSISISIKRPIGRLLKIV